MQAFSARGERILSSWCWQPVGLAGGTCPVHAVGQRVADQRLRGLLGQGRRAQCTGGHGYLGAQGRVADGAQHDCRHIFPRTMPQ